MAAFTIVLRNIVSNLFIYKNQPTSEVLDFYEQQQFVWFTAVDFLRGMTMLYLFYVQGRFSIEQELSRKAQENQKKLREAQEAEAKAPERILDSLRASMLTDYSHLNQNKEGSKDGEESPDLTIMLNTVNMQ